MGWESILSENTKVLFCLTWTPPYALATGKYVKDRFPEPCNSHGGLTKRTCWLYYASFASDSCPLWQSDSGSLAGLVVENCKHSVSSHETQPTVLVGRLPLSDNNIYSSSLSKSYCVAGRIFMKLFLHRITADAQNNSVWQMVS